jgi:hypothetical protein
MPRLRYTLSGPCYPLRPPSDAHPTSAALIKDALGISVGAVYGDGSIERIDACPSSAALVATPDGIHVVCCVLPDGRPAPLDASQRQAFHSEVALGGNELQQRTGMSIYLCRPQSSIIQSTAPKINTVCGCGLAEPLFLPNMLKSIASCMRKFLSSVFVQQLNE